jgi:hypothetical protein
MAVQRSFKTNLAATGNNGDTWDSGWFQVEKHDNIAVTVVSDQATSVAIQQSGDGSLVDTVDTNTPAAATLDGSGNVTAGGYTEVVPCLLAYARVVVKNTTATPTTRFRAYVRTISAGPGPR